MAKGVEDTAFYRWSRLVALNEVGGDPDRFGISPAEFHAFAARLAADWPASMTTLSTHDTKRQEDVRARLAVLAELPEALGGRGGRLARLGRRGAAARHERRRSRTPEYLMWQTLAGGLAARPGAADRVPGQGDARGQDPRPRGPTRTRVRVAGARPCRAGARRPGADRREIAAFVAGIAPDGWSQLPRRQARPAHHARRGRHLPGLRADRRSPGRPGQPPRRPTSPARRELLAALDAGDRHPAVGPPGRGRSCWSPPGRCGCAAITRTGSPAVHAAGRRRPGRRHAVASPAAGTRSPSSPGCRWPAARAAAGPTPCCRCRGWHWRDLLTGCHGTLVCGRCCPSCYSSALWRC